MASLSKIKKYSSESGGVAGQTELVVLAFSSTELKSVFYMVLCRSESYS